MAAPGVLFRGLYHAGTNRIEMNITDQFQQIAVAIHQYRFVTPLKKMARSLFTPVDPAGIAEGEILHTTRKRNVPGLQNKMDMVGHAAKSVNAVTEATSSFLQQQEETVMVKISEKDRLTGISPENDMIQSARKMNTWFTCHTGNLLLNNNLSTWKPDPTATVRVDYFRREFPMVRFVSGVRKKPFPDGLQRIMEISGAAPCEVMMLDDRLLTGVLGACLVGVGVVYITAPYVSLAQRPLHESFFMLLRILERGFITLVSRLP